MSFSNRFHPLVHWQLFILMLFASVTIRAELSITLVSPDNNSYYPACGNVMLKAQVSSDSEEIRDVAFYRNSGAVIRRLRSEPWEFTWEGVKPGFYPLFAKVRGVDGGEAWSDTLYIVVGDVQKGDKIINGGFDCDGKISPWVTSLHGTASVTFNVYDDFYFDDATYLSCEIANGSDTDWHIQFLQKTGLDSGHVYQIYFYADAEYEKTIAINWQENGNDWTVHWQHSDILIEGADYYGPFEFACTVTDPTADFKFILGGDDIDVYLDSVSIIDLNATSVEANDEPIVSGFELFPAFPNPFNMHTVIRYKLPQSTSIQLDVFNMQGRKVRTLVSGRQSQGEFSFTWDGADDFGYDVSSGVYVYRLIADSDGTPQQQSRKVLVLK